MGKVVKLKTCKYFENGAGTTLVEHLKEYWLIDMPVALEFIETLPKQGYITDTNKNFWENLKPSHKLYSNYLVQVYRVIEGPKWLVHSLVYIK